jgi:predicted nucleic acid-binding protein
VIVVADAGPLILLGRTGQLRLLEQLFTRVVVPDAVWAEVMVDEATRPGAREIEGAAWLERQPDVPALAVGSLGVGETQALALAAHLGADRVLLDDLAARKEATRRGLAVVGTLGILVSAHKAGLLVDLSEGLLAIRAAGLLVSDALIAEVIATASRGPREPR